MKRTMSIALLSVLFVLSLSTSVFADAYDAEVTLYWYQESAKSNSTHLNNTVTFELKNYTNKQVKYILKKDNGTVGAEGILNGYESTYVNANISDNNKGDYRLVLKCSTGYGCSAYAAVHDY